jgi:DNA-binding MarR family transcriptional regulator
MTTPDAPPRCNLLALRQASRHLSRLYDQQFAPLGLKGSQYSILSRLAAGGASSINALAATLVMDRTTLGRNIRPLEREGWITIAVDPGDARGRLLEISAEGRAVLAKARVGWRRAQERFETVYGGTKAAALRTMLAEVVQSEL